VTIHGRLVNEGWSAGPVVDPTALGVSVWPAGQGSVPCNVYPGQTSHVTVDGVSMLLRTIDEPGKHVQSLCAQNFRGLAVSVSLDLGVPGTHDRPLPNAAKIGGVLFANRAPSAGFSQGYALLTLEGPDQLGPFWQLMSTYQAGEASAGASAGPAFEPVTRAPLVVVPLSCKDIYLDRYARPDKGWTDRDQAHWPVPYWDIDTGLPV
jgi:hypothetical protein